jgi:hypothetical protein
VDDRGLKIKKKVHEWGIAVAPRAGVDLKYSIAAMPLPFHAVKLPVKIMTGCE